MPLKSSIYQLTLLQMLEHSWKWLAEKEVHKGWERASAETHVNISPGEEIFMILLLILFCFFKDNF